MMQYFKITNLEGQLIGVASSANLCYYEPVFKNMLRTDLTKVQYILFENQFYHGVDFFPEPEELLEKNYPKVIVTFCDKEFYDKFYK